MINIKQLLSLLAVYSLISGCAIQPGISSQGLEIGSYHVSETGKPQYWWYARFRIVWPPDTDPDFAVDLLLADALVKPELHAYRQNIKYWRFHRRAVRDNAGHQFSFIFYADKDTASTIYSSLTKNELATQLRRGKVIDEIIMDNLDHNPRTDIKDTSDKNWSEEIQTAWPAYIMGVSSMWLQLIEQEIGDHDQAADINSLLEKYRTANRKITTLWQTEAQHALLHHMNAIFGYEPFVIKKAIQF